MIGIISFVILSKLLSLSEALEKTCEIFLSICVTSMIVICLYWQHNSCTLYCRLLRGLYNKSSYKNVLTVKFACRCHRVNSSVCLSVAQSQQFSLPVSGMESGYNT